MSDLAQYITITYLIEIVAISLVSLALIAVIGAIFFRRWSGKEEHKKMLAMRHSMQHEKNKVDITISEIIDVERATHDNLAATKVQMKAMVEQQKVISNKSKEIELRAEHIALLENDVQQTAEILSKRIDGIEKRWDEKLEHTVKTVDQLSLILEDNLKHIKNQHIIANNLTQSLTDQYDQLQLEKKQRALQASMDTTLKASVQLNTQLENLQQKAEGAFSHFSGKLDHLEQEVVEKQLHLNESHILFEDVESIAPSVKETTEQTFEHLDKPTLLRETNTKQNEKRPLLDSIAAEDLTNPSLLKDYPYKDFFPTNKKKVNQ